MISNLMSNTQNHVDVKAAHLVASRFAACSCQTPEPHPMLSVDSLSQSGSTCRQMFGYNSRSEMLAWINVYDPDLNEIYSMSGTKQRKLTDFEEACTTRMFFRTSFSIKMIAALWQTGRRRCGNAIAKWAQKWEFHAKRWCRLRFSRDYLMKCQILGKEDRYGVPISHLVDGTVCQTQHPQGSNTAKKCMWNKKINKPGTLALAHATLSGLILFATDMFGGNATEADLVRIYRSWWSAYPHGFGRLVDKGFARMTNLHYTNGNKAIYPAFLTRNSIEYSICRTPQLTRDEVVDSSQQSTERYVIETSFSRVKSEKLIENIVSWHNTRYINAAYTVGCATANHLKPLKNPGSWVNLEQDFENAKALVQVG